MDTMKFYYFAIPTFILAALFHPNLNNKLHADVAWTFALYYEAMAMFPQLDLFRKKGGEIESFTSHYVASTGLSRLLHFCFWVASYSELNEELNRYSFLPMHVGYFVLAS